MAAPAWWIPYIRARAKQLNLDPQAVLAVAQHEGLSGRDGDNHTSFGPFQMHIGGALPRGKGRAWAESRPGIDYALKAIQRVAGGMTGRAAVTNIAKRFERPADPAAEIADAMAHYGHVTGGGQASGNFGGRGFQGVPGGPQMASPTSDSFKQQAFQTLISMAQNGGQGGGAMDLLSLAMTRQGLQNADASGAAGATPMQTGVNLAGAKGTIKWSGKSLQGEKPDFIKKVTAAAKSVGGTQVRVNSGYRSPAHNKAVGGAKDSNHMYGRAMDADVYIPGKGWVPLGQALQPVAPRFGLRSGATFNYGGRPDLPHVDDAYNQHH